MQNSITQNPLCSTFIKLKITQVCTVSVNNEYIMIVE
jgi:hypothetical protein